MTKFYLLREAANILGVRPHQLVYALKSGFVREPSIRLGAVRAFSRDEIEAARIFFDKEKHNG